MNSIKTLFSSLVIATYCIGVLAQSGTLEEVIVTAQKRSESLQDVPVAVNAFSADTIQAAGINDASDLAIMTPSLNANSSTSPFTTRLTIRGIGTAQSDPALEPSVGLFVDGVFMSRSGLGTSDLTDIERIEVLQGPQGTLYGKNSNAGAISVISKRPNIEEFEGYLETSAGSYSLGKLTATVSGPLSDTVAYRISGNVHRRDGYYNNGGSGMDDQNNADDWNLQAKLQWMLTDRLSMLLSAAHVERDTTCCGADSTQGEAVQQELMDQGLAPDLNDPYDFKTATDRQDSYSLKSDLVTLHIEYDIEFASITAITAWSDYNYTTTYDADRTELDMLSIVDEQNRGDSISQELRLDAASGNSFDYQLGIFYYEQTTQRGDGSPTLFVGEDFATIADQQDLGFPAFALIAQPGDHVAYQNIWDTEALALFGQATWHIGERWHATGGLRYTVEEREAELFVEPFSTAPLAPTVSFVGMATTPIDATLDRGSESLDWLARLSFDFWESSIVYGSVSTGTKSGNFNGVNGTPEEREFDDEHTISYELGMKSTLLESTLRFNAAAFYTVVEDYQYQAAAPSGIGTIVSNDGEAQVSGIDIQLDAVPLPNLTLTAGLLYMHDYDVTGGERKGQALPWTAEFSGNLGATLVFPLANGVVYLRGDYIFMDEHLTNGSSEATLEAPDFAEREVLNLKLGWRNDNWNISVWGKNLTDDEYAIQTSNTLPFSGGKLYFLAPPKTYGATLRYDF